eukprot:symbB.v1.2.016057.t1/scaffold1125.1/size136522/5
MLKSIQLTDVLFTLPPHDACGSASNILDPYFIFKSQRVTLGDSDSLSSASRRSSRRKTEKSPSYPGPFLVTFGGLEDAEQLSLELWNHNALGDEQLQQVCIDFRHETIFGRKTLLTSPKGSVSFTWKLNRSEAKPPRSVGAATLRIQRVALSTDALAQPWYLLLTGQSLESQQRWDWAADSKEQLEEREIAYDQQGYLVEIWRTAEEAGRREPNKNPAQLVSRFGAIPAGDVLLGDGIFQATATDAPTTEKVDISNGSQLEFLYSVSMVGPPKPPLEPPVVRKEIRLMPEEEQQRFLRALRKLMENKGEVQSSEYFRLAAYHGWPENYCVHGQESFPGWHRGYLRELEKALMEETIDLSRLPSSSSASSSSSLSLPVRLLHFCSTAVLTNPCLLPTLVCTACPPRWQ